MFLLIKNPHALAKSAYEESLKVKPPKGSGKLLEWQVRQKERVESHYRSLGIKI